MNQMEEALKKAGFKTSMQAHPIPVLPDGMRSCNHCMEPMPENKGVCCSSQCFMERYM